MERDVVHVEDHAHALGIGVVDHGLHVVVRFQRVARAFRTVPARVKLDVLEVVAQHEFHARLAALLAELGDAQDLARLDPRSVGDPRGRVQRVHERGLSVRELYAVLRHTDVPPRRDVRRCDRGRALQDALHLALLRAARETDARIVQVARFAQRRHPAVPLHDERALARAGTRTGVVGVPLVGDCRKRQRNVLALRVAHGPALEVAPEVKRPFLVRDRARCRSAVADAPRDAAGQVRGLDHRVRRQARRRHAADGFTARRRDRERGGKNGAGYRH